MIFLEIKIESMLFYNNAKEFRDDLKSYVDLDLVEKCRKKLEDNENIRFVHAFLVKEIENEKIDEMKKFFYISTFKFFNKEELDRVVNDEDFKSVYGDLKKTHFHKSQRIYEVKDKMFTYL